MNGFERFAPRGTAVPDDLLDVVSWIHTVVGDPGSLVGIGVEIGVVTGVGPAAGRVRVRDDARLELPAVGAELGEEVRHRRTPDRVAAGPVLDGSWTCTSPFDSPSSCDTSANVHSKQCRSITTSR